MTGDGPRLACRTLAALFLLGCGPTVVWYGKTLDRRHRVQLVVDRDVAAVTVDGERGPAFDAIAAQSLTLSPTGRIAYAGRRGTAWMVVTDRHVGVPWDGVAELRFSADGQHLAAVVERAGRWTVVRDGVAGPWLDEVLAGSVRFSDDGARLAWAGRTGGRAHVIVDGQMGPAWDGVGAIAFGPRGAPLVHLGRDGEAVHVVIDGHPGPPWARVTSIAVAPAGDRVAYAAVSATGWQVVVDGAIHPASSAPAELQFDPSGRRVAWRVGGQAFLDGRALAGPAAEVRHLVFRQAGDLLYAARDAAGWHVMVNGMAGPAYDGLTAPVTAGGRWALLARRGGVHLIVVDGREVARESWASPPVLSSGGGRVAWLARRGARTAVVVDGHEHVFDLVQLETLAFSRDGHRWGCLAGSRAERALFLVVDGERIEPVDVGELAAEAVRGGDLRLRAWVTAELDAH